MFWLLFYHIFLIYNFKTTYEHYRSKTGPNLFFNRKTFCNIFKIIFRKIPRSFLKLQETIFFEQNSPNTQIKPEKTEPAAIDKSKEEKTLPPNRIPIKTIEKEKEREEAIKENNLDNLFIKEGVILEDIPDDYLDKIHVFSENLSMGKSYLHTPMPAKNNFLDNEVNKYNKEVFKLKNIEEYMKKNSFELSPQTTMKQNKSYIIEKENEDVSMEKKNYSTFLCNKDEQLLQDNNDVKNVKRRVSRENLRNNSKSNENITDFKGIDQSFKTVKSDNNL